MKSSALGVLALLACVLAAAGVETNSIATTTERKPGEYKLGPDSLPQTGAPKGKLEGPFPFKSKILTNTVRLYWVYVPAQYKPESAANVLVFQDGQRATNPDGALRVPQVLENLIHKGDIPVTVGIFITPGQRGEEYPTDLGMRNPNNRAAEYDSLSDSYSRFVCEEMLPEVGKNYNLSKDPERRAIGGTSSGAICSFTVAWQRPEEFRNVISMIGSYTSIGYRPARDGQPMIPGGDLYPTLIRKNPIKPIKIFLQDGSNDLNNDHGNWFLANQEMLSALEFANAKADRANTSGARYRINHEWGDGAHSDNLALDVGERWKVAQASAPAIARGVSPRVPSGGETPHGLAAGTAALPSEFCLSSIVSCIYGVADFERGGKLFGINPVMTVEMTGSNHTVTHMQRLKKSLQCLSVCALTVFAILNLTGCQTSEEQSKTSASTAATPAPAVAPAKAVEPKVALPTVRINAGRSTAYTDKAGNVWLADQGFVGGDVVERLELTIGNTSDPTIYQTERYSMESFSHPLPDGKYIVKLHFAETFEGITDKGQRVFNFNVEGQEFKDFDVFLKAGGVQKAYIETVPVNITDGKLDIKFTHSIENPEINGIEIIPGT